MHLASVLAQQFVTERANRKWVSDITYVRVRGQWLYLAAVMDLFSRAIVGWAIRHVDDGQADFRCFQHGTGPQYRAMAYQDLVRSSGAIISMSRKSNCWGNAVMESFFSRLKVELVYGEKFHSIQHVKSCMFE